MSIFNNFPAVGVGGDTSDATATAADILQGKTAYGADGKITGTIPSVEGKQIVPKAAGQIAVAGNVYTTGARIIPKEDNFIPANIRKDVSIWGVVGTLDPGSTPTPDPNLIPANVKAGVTIDGVTGTFTSDANATAESMQQGVSAYVKGQRVVGTAPIQAAKTVTPTTTEQIAVASGSFTSGEVKVEGDANLVAENIKEGVSIFGVMGTLDPGSTPTPDPNLIPANVKAGVTIDGVTGTFTSDANATAESMQQGVSAYVKGQRVVGTAPIQAAKTVTPTTTEQIAVASGSFTSGEVKVEGDANLVAENIKEGVSIFGVTGTLAGGGGSGVTTYSHLDTWQQISMGSSLTITMDHQPTVIVFYVSNAMTTTAQSTASSVTLNTTGNFVATSRTDNGPSIPRPTITSTGFTYSYGAGANCWIKYVAY